MICQTKPATYIRIRNNLVKTIFIQCLFYSEHTSKYQTPYMYGHFLAIFFLFDLLKIKIKTISKLYTYVLYN